MKKTFAFLATALCLFSGAAPAQQDKQDTLTDPQIAAILTEANDADIQNGKFAQKHATNPEVKAFAERMVKDHRQLNEEASALMKRINLKPEGSPLLRTVQAAGKAAKKKLDDLKGAEFDRTYMDREVAMHRMVLENIDNRLLPSAKNEELRSLIEKARPIIASHLEHARSLLGQLGGPKEGS